MQLLHRVRCLIMKISFFGAAKRVTGSCYHLISKNHQFIIDCGMYQGLFEEEQLNQVPFEFDPSKVDFMILTHAHLDHCGRIPLLVKAGFTGKIFCTRPTAEIVNILLRDSGGIQEEEAAWENKRRQRAGLDPVKPLYTVDDAINALQYLNPVSYDTPIQIDSTLTVTFKEAGHLLGSAFIELAAFEEGHMHHYVFSGDLGTGDNGMLNPPSYPGNTECLILESTYGNKLHQRVEERNARLATAIEETLKNGGTVIIPSFAVGRTQEILFELRRYYEAAGRYDFFLSIPFYVDSPLAVSATRIYEKQGAYMRPDIGKQFTATGSPLQSPNITFISSIKESAALNGDSTPKVIISASGMCEAGRIKHHLKHHLWDPRTSVIFVGYQGEGTLGRSLTEGIDRVEILNETIKVNARILQIEGFSGHGDYEDILRWLDGATHKPRQIILVHGEPLSMEGLSVRLKEKFDASIHIPDLGESFIYPPLTV